MNNKQIIGLKQINISLRGQINKRPDKRLSIRITTVVVDTSLTNIWTDYCVVPLREQSPSWEGVF